ncbi:MAG: M1 family peptidase, partial [Bacteroidota bacterium]|nr:M1 family peptidase [Bacteroidota bacterium]
MKRHFLPGALLGAALLAAGPALAQTVNTGPAYDSRTLFSPEFIEQLSTPTRTAGGQPGADYWQNAADYKIDARLDEKAARVSATVAITYTNNSPDALAFVWLQVEQNLYREDSRGAAITPVGGGRFGNNARGFRGGDSLQTVSIELHGKKMKANYRVTDTRMQILLPEALKPNGDKLKIDIAYGF